MIRYFNLKSLRPCLVDETFTINETMKAIDKGAIQIALCERQKKIIGVLTDGDLRRALISGSNLDSKIKDLLNKKPRFCANTASTWRVERQMRIQNIKHLPAVNKNNHLVGLFLSTPSYCLEKETAFVIMAGGKGKRLKPLTNKKPKALIEYKGKPLIINILEKAKSEGFESFWLLLNHQAGQIKNFFMQKKSQNINFIVEKRPLGTAGGLALVAEKIDSEYLLVTNTDVITSASYSKIVEYINETKADVVLGVHEHELKNEFGNVHLKNNSVLQVKEKEKKSCIVNSGIYAIKKEVLRHIRKNKMLDMPSFINELIKEKYNVKAYFIHELWKDVGTKSALFENSK